MGVSDRLEDTMENMSQTVVLTCVHMLLRAPARYPCQRSDAGTEAARGFEATASPDDCWSRSTLHLSSLRLNVDCSLRLYRWSLEACHPSKSERNLSRDMADDGYETHHHRMYYRKPSNDASMSEYERVVIRRANSKYLRIDVMNASWKHLGLELLCLGIYVAIWFLLDLFVLYLVRTFDSSLSVSFIVNYRWLRFLVPRIALPATILLVLAKRLHFGQTSLPT
ncbi:hypothetical protein P171DRAFT_485979 [Karstenula rhodostoma CBS 690.94]|uniref:Uncharacterized protein n=1 Tax=Karstenula rhodostoma CBS 690.94 TaxID=1392251 RepID=A0A9P4PGA8_9PLEO|nr:hypothetical protein P171DRAFT_485979 [Karstenula rhodostoma CBS 690.94]